MREREGEKGLREGAIPSCPPPSASPLSLWVHQLWAQSCAMRTEEERREREMETKRGRERLQAAKREQTREKKRSQMRLQRRKGKEALLSLLLVVVGISQAPGRE